MIKYILELILGYKDLCDYCSHQWRHRSPTNVPCPKCGETNVGMYR